MATFNTSCPNISNLDGSCEIENGEITSYTSTALNLTTTDIKVLSGPELHVKVTFTVGPPPTTIKYKYKIKANLSGKNWTGSAELDDEEKKEIVSDYEDSWAATSVTVQPAVAAKGTS